MPRKKRTEAQEARRFGVVLPVVLAALAGLSLWLGHPRRAALLATGVGFAAVLPWVAPPLWLRFFKLWMRLAEALGWFSTRVILSTFFYLVLTPVGLVMRLLGRDPLDLAWKDGRQSYWKDKEPIPENLETYERQY